MKLRRWLVPALVLVAILLIGGLVFLLFSGGQNQGTSVTYTVRSGTISASVRAVGKVESTRSQNLAFRTAEVVRRIYVKPGDTVPAGTLLAEIDTTNLERNLAQAEGQRDIARYNPSAADEKAASGPTPTPAPTPTTPSVPASFSGLYGLAKQAELADMQVAAARQALEGGRIYAPFDGTVIAINVQEGEFINGPLMSFADLNSLQVRADIDELDVPNVEVGQQVNITLDAFPGRTFPARVSSLAPSATQRQGSSVYQAVVNFTAKPTVKMRPGMAANLAITSLSKNDVLVVPSNALETIGLKRYVNLVKADGSTEKVPVETGLTNGRETEIVSGLKAGDRISYKG